MRLITKFMMVAAASVTIAVGFKVERAFAWLPPSGPLPENFSAQHGSCSYPIDEEHPEETFTPCLKNANNEWVPYSCVIQQGKKKVSILIRQTTDGDLIAPASPATGLVCGP